MNKGIELCGIKLGDTLDENKFKIVKKESIPGGDYMSEIAKPSWIGRMQSTSTEQEKYIDECVDELIKNKEYRNKPKGEVFAE